VRGGGTVGGNASVAYRDDKENGETMKDERRGRSKKKKREEEGGRKDGVLTNANRTTVTQVR